MQRAKTFLTIGLLAGLLAVSGAQAKKLDFSLVDSYGRNVNAEDYAGVPIFLEFGACW